MMERGILIVLLSSLFFFQSASSQAQANRVYMDLNGPWEIEESVDSLAIPHRFNHRVNVPGMVNQAKPSFPGVDEYTTSDLLFNLKVINELTPFVDSGAYTSQERNYFWYKKNFTLPREKQKVFFKVKKAQFGSAVWINNRLVGRNLACFTSQTYDITDFILRGRENSVIIRVGAHPGVLPKEIPYGIDYEKYKWTPGIYDEVELFLCDNPVIEHIQIAPHIHDSFIVVQSRVKNVQDTLTFVPGYEVKEWKSKQLVKKVMGKKVCMNPHETKLITDTIPLPGATWWNTENPFLYVLNVSTPGDQLSSRFGMREFRFDTPTRRAYLNDKMIFLRGSNITLHRFFEDPKCASLPWNETWVRKLLGAIPDSMSWNSFRFTIGPVPDKWFDIADEEGLLIQNEFFLWTLSGIRNDIPDYWSFEELKRQLKIWMSDSWNHPSLVIWDLMNESHSEKIHKNQLIKELRTLDLSGRPWESSFNPPDGPHDVIEFHPYVMNRGFYPFNQEPYFDLVEFESMYPTPNNYSFLQTGQSMLVNEYGWLWMNRDGSPTLLTKRIYDYWLGEHSTARERYEFYASVLAGHTEFLRAYRTYAGVHHFVYLTSSHPGAITSDNFRDIEKLDLEPHFADYVGEAFKPLGVYLNFWQPKQKPGEHRRVTIMMVNDTHEVAKGVLILSIENARGETVTETRQSYVLAELGQQSYYAEISMPDIPGNYVLKARALNTQSGSSTVSRRKVTIE